MPNKNIRPLLGKPIIAWTIEEAKKSRLLTRTIVSTDSEEIASIATQYGGEAPFLRPAELAGDLSLGEEFLLHALDWLKAKESYEPDIVLRLPPTSPLRTAAHIDEGIQKLIDTPEADSVRPIMESPKHPYKMWKVSTGGKWVEPLLPEAVTKMREPYNQSRQALPEVYIHTGAMDVMRLRTIRELKSTSGEKIAYFRMAPEDSVNIDSEIDLLLCEILLRHRLDLR